MKITASLLRKFIMDNHGKIVIWQTPNVPLIGWLTFSIVARLLPHSSLQTTCAFLATSLLFTWAYLELRAGAAPVRHVLGLIVMVGILIQYWR